jgi:hypothetical protein
MSETKEFQDDKPIFYGFPHIERFSNIHDELKKNYKERILPTYKFIGSVKVHGSNTSVIMLADGSLQYQSKNNVLAEHFDNSNFKTFMMQRHANLLLLFAEIKKNIKPKNAIIGIYGEYAGKGIQKHVAVSMVDPFFVIFAIRIYCKNNYWLSFDEFRNIKCVEERIINITDFPMYEIEINFNDVELSQSLLNKYTEDVCYNCPVGKYFGIDGMGEGVVWHAIDSARRGNKNELFGFMFKTKQFEMNHPVIDKSDIIKEFIRWNITEELLNQGISNIVEIFKLTKENYIEKIDDFSKFVLNDILREERIIIREQKFNLKDMEKLKKSIINTARDWYIQYVNMNAIEELQQNS